jgi:hypothetical protein
MATTITFDEINNAWTSFHSYEPEWMERIGNNFYSFKNGNLYLHDDNDTRTNFYGTSYGCNIEYSANDGPSDVKLFKTLSLESNNSNWYVTLDTEIESGAIGASGDYKFQDKEGLKYAYIRRLSSDNLNFNELSILGLGTLQSIPSSNNYTFSSNIPNQVLKRDDQDRGGDKLYFNDGSTQLVGVIDDISEKTITTAASANIPSVNDFCFVVKDPESESFGLRGYHAKIKLTNDSTSFVELYAVNSEVIKSFV